MLYGKQMQDCSASLVGLEVWSMLLFGPEGKHVAQHSPQRLFEVLVQSPELLSMYTQNDIEKRKVNAMLGVRHHTQMQKYDKALEALSYGAYNPDDDPGVCLITMYTDNIALEGKALELAQALVARLSIRDTNGLRRHFSDPAWKALLMPGDDVDDVREMFIESRTSYNSFFLQFTH